MRTVHFLVPAELDDSAQPSGGNVYAHRIHDGLAEAGWDAASRRMADVLSAAAA